MQANMEDPSAVLETAIANEMEGHRILQRGREAATEPLAKATFEFLANEELKHIEIIRDFAKTLDGVTPWDESVLKGGSLSDAFKHVRSIFERFGAQFEAVSASDHERLEIYEVAMDMERRGYEFYSRAAQQASDERARRLFSFLAGEEQRHFQMIQDTHDFLQEPDALLAMEERWMQI